MLLIDWLWAGRLFMYDMLPRPPLGIPGAHGGLFVGCFAAIQYLSHYWSLSGSNPGSRTTLTASFFGMSEYATARFRP